MLSLCDMYSKHQGKVTDKWTSYLSRYDELFTTIRNRQICLLEIGVQNGGSLEIWAKYFRNARKLIGCDIDPNCSKLCFDDQRISVVIGDVNTDEVETIILNQAGSFDIIIDDGSHKSGDVIKTFARYFRYLNYGGLYIIEDLHCSYHKAWDGGLYHPYSAISFLKRLVDIINFEHWGLLTTRGKVLNGYLDDFVDNKYLQEIGSVAFFNSICVIYKKNAGENDIGVRQIAGKIAVVNPLAGLADSQGEPICIRNINEATSLWSSIDTAPDSRLPQGEQIANLNRALVDRDEQIANLNRALVDRDEQIANLNRAVTAVLSSSSWRITSPLRSLPVFGRRLVKQARRGVVLLFQGRISERQSTGTLGGRPADPYCDWILQHDYNPTRGQLAYAEKVRNLSDRPLFSVLMPVYNTEAKLLNAAIQSVIDQIYPHWELCIANDASTAPHIRPHLDSWAARDDRIRIVHRETNGHVAEATNSAFALASGDWIALLDHDDLLRPHALAELALEIAAHPETEVIYSDEDKIDRKGRRCDPYFKPDWSPDLFRAQNYLNHLTVHRADNIRQVGGWRRGFDGSQDYDLNLRITERIRPETIRHISKILYHWRLTEGSTAADGEAKGYARNAAMRALQEHIDRLGLKGRIEEIPGIPYFRTKFAVPDPPPLVSLLIPTRDRPDLLGPCIDSILTKTTYPAYEIVIIDNGSAEHDTFALFDRLRTDPRIRIVGYHHPFNYSAINNFGVAHVNGTILGLVNNDIEVLSSEWLDEMVSHAVRPEIGCVGAKLLYPDGCVQHGGVILGIGRVAGHSHRFFAGNDPGYFGRLQVAQNISAVTGACLVVRRSVYEEVGGFDERLTVAFNDVDFCLKVRSKGYLILWTPFALLIHRESSSRGGEDTTEKVARFNSEINVMRQRWRDVLDADPYYSRHLSVEHEDFRLKVN